MPAWFNPPVILSAIRRSKSNRCNATPRKSGNSSSTSAGHNLYQTSFFEKSGRKWNPNSNLENSKLSRHERIKAR